MGKKPQRVESQVIKLEDWVEESGQITKKVNYCFRVGDFNMQLLFLLPVSEKVSVSEHDL